MTVIWAQKISQKDIQFRDLKDSEFDIHTDQLLLHGEAMN